MKKFCKFYKCKKCIFSAPHDKMSKKVFLIISYLIEKIENNLSLETGDNLGIKKFYEIMSDYGFDLCGFKENESSCILIYIMLYILEMLH